MQEILNNVKYLALRLLDAGEDQNGKKMHKILHPGTFYYFYDGVEITKDEILVEPEVPQELYRVNPKLNNNIEVNLCAIVGENGSGKSSVVDYIIRILNNLAAYILGENYRSPKAEHLHYIPHVYAELYILIGANIFQIVCRGKTLEVQPYVYKEKDVFEKIYTSLRFSGVTTKGEIVPEHNELYHIISRLCYTIVVNYSLYAFDPDNYRDESTSVPKESKIRKLGKLYDDDIELYETIRKKAIASDDDRALVSSTSWLQGLFHKSDGYQVPIVISPFRKNGEINLRSEHGLAKERLLSLVFMHDLDSGERLFKNINRKLLVDGFILKANYSKNHSLKNVHKNLRNYIEDLTKEGCDALFGFIKEQVANEFKITRGQKLVLETEAWNYIVFKIIKITFTYSRYAAIRGSLLAIKDCLSEDDKHNIHEHLLNLWADHSHITRKLYRTIYYLHFNIIGTKRSFKIENYRKTIMPKVGRNPADLLLNPPHYEDELLPPPIFEVDFTLYDINDKKLKKRIPFSTLSSGEKQVTYTLTSFYYHLMNLNSKHDVAARVGGSHLRNLIPINSPITPTNFRYNHVTLIFDEIELYFHPEMQRTFIANLLDGIGQLGLTHIRSIQIMMVTHSPFILSDVPKSNVLFLKKDGYPTREERMKTFGANIHHILKNSFFLQNGTMGLYAQKEINKLIQEINFCKFSYQLGFLKGRTIENNQKKDYLLMNNHIMLDLLSSKILSKNMNEEQIISSGKTLYESRYDYWRNMAQIIEEPIIRDTILKQLSELDKYVDN